MPLPQVSDRIKELPGQALRAVFAGVGQLLLAAEKVREQLAAPADQQAQPSATPAPESPAPAPPAAAAAAPSGSSVAPPEVTDPADSRWRSLDKTGNVRVLHDGDPDLGRPASPPPAAAGPAPAEVPEPAADEVAEPAPAQVTEPEPAEPAVPTTAEVAQPEPAEPAVPTPAEVATPAPAEPVPAEPILAATPEPAEVTATPEPAAALPVAGYDQLSVASLRARLRVLDLTQVQTLLDYEKAHQSRADVVTMFERRIAKLEQGG